MAGSPAVEADSSLVTTTKEPTPEASVVTFNDDGGESRTRGARRQGFALRRIQSIDSCSMGGKGRRTTTPLAGESVSSSGSTCAEPNHEELLMSVGSVLHRQAWARCAAAVEPCPALRPTACPNYRSRRLLRRISVTRRLLRGDRVGAQADTGQ